MQNSIAFMYTSKEVKYIYIYVIYYRVKKLQIPRNKSHKIYAKTLCRRL